MKRILLLIIIIVLYSCKEEIPASSGAHPDIKTEKSMEKAPPNSKIIRVLGNGWLYFELDGYVYLLNRPSFQEVYFTKIDTLLNFNSMQSNIQLFKSFSGDKK